MLNMLLVLSILGVLCVTAKEIYTTYKLQLEKQAKLSKIKREISTQAKLDEKRMQFEEFKKLIESYDKDCNECYENNYTQYIGCHPKDYDGLERRKKVFDLTVDCKMIPHQSRQDYVTSYYENLENPVRNLRAMLQDFTVEEISNLYSL